MGFHTRKLLYSWALSAVFAASGSASPLNSKLLSLVPPGAEIVAGFENYRDVHRHGQLLLSTHKDRLDLDDWQALAGVDNQRVFDEVIEVAASSPEGEMLTEHLVLVAGLLNRERIFRSAELNGSQKSFCEGQPIMVIEPFEREKTEMQASRWLVILNDRIGMLGTPFLVEKALHRFLTHAGIDMPLLERLSQLPHDDTSWNVLLWSPKVLRNYSALATGGWGRLLDGADVLLVGARFGSRVRIDFSLHADEDRGPAFFTQKGRQFADVFTAEPSLRSRASRSCRLDDLSPNPDHVQGSVELSSKQYEEWGRQATSHPHVYLVARSISNGE